MKYLKFLLLSVFLGSALMFFSCDKEDDDNNQQNAGADYEILIYGRPSCGLCQGFKDDCDAEELDYTFYDIDTDDEKNTEMWDKLNEAGMGGSNITLPIVDVVIEGESNMFESPDIEEVLEILP
ncbi:MAG: glutaredoxin family protein [Bacteroidales bacterium]